MSKNLSPFSMMFHGIGSSTNVLINLEWRNYFWAITSDTLQFQRKVKNYTSLYSIRPFQETKQHEKVDNDSLESKTSWNSLCDKEKDSSKKIHTKMKGFLWNINKRMRWIRILFTISWRKCSLTFFIKFPEQNNVWLVEHIMS
jgi:hypothetical protein